MDPLQIPMMNLDMLFIDEDATVTICHSKTRDLARFTRDADILVTAVGNRQEFCLTAEKVKDGAVVIDVGVTRIDGKVCGDADFAEVSRKVSFITPVPGGVGPMTVAMLLENTLTAASLQTGRSLSELSEQP